MGKNKRLKSNPKKSTKGRAHPTPFSKPKGISKSAASPSTKHGKSTTTTTSSKPTPKKQHTAPTIPFSPRDSILLIGDGDLSFASSLISHHKAQHLTATVYEDSLPTLREKYPHVDENIKVIEEGGGAIKYGVDATKMKAWTTGKNGRGEGVMDRIFFNFPHVGGKSTDVNRQVRYNQELLVAFFQRALPSLSPRHGASIIVTLFEGHPYTLWNIRDLGRHAGLEVERSFRFQAGAYPGYRHARTLGMVRGGGGWKGEEREARSYVFVRRGEGAVMGVGKRKRGESSDEEEEEEEDGGEGEGWSDDGGEDGVEEEENGGGVEAEDEAEDDEPERGDSAADIERANGDENVESSEGD
ncbi:hypothetical protein CJF32_00000907 [Rutstroemia sp. NJR-2017a WRK4]|nr:hypothetical protein CJF32_00000907 [Rutstroemia sp. NJR-2017a WRK4]